MLQESGYIGTLVAIFIEFVILTVMSSRGLPFIFREQFAELSAADALIPYLKAEGSSAQKTLHPCVKRGTFGFHLVEILSSRIVFMPLIMVIPAIQIELRGKMNATQQDVSTHSSHPSLIAFPLVCA